MNKSPAYSLVAGRFSSIKKAAQALAATALMMVGCGEMGASDIDTEVSELRSASTVASFNPAVGQLPESLTADAQGNFYMSMGNTVTKLAKNGQLSVYAQLPTPAGTFATGVKFGPDGLLYVCSASFNPADDASAVYRVAANGVVSQVAHLDPASFPNDLAFGRGGTLYVTDPFKGQLFRITSSGQASVWVQDPILLGNAAAPYLTIHDFGVDGIALDEDKDTVYVGNLDYGRIIRIPITRSGAAGTPRVWVEDAKLLGADGIAFDAAGNLFVAVNGQDQVARVDDCGRVSIVAKGTGLDAPSSLVFGQSGRDKRTLYFTNFAILRALGVRPGAPQPSLMSIPVRFPGQGIP